MLKKIEDEIGAWPIISVQPHQFAAKEFRFGSAEVGHLHEGGVLDIPFTRSIRNAPLADGLAEEHSWVPNSGWITFHTRGDEDCRHALWLMRLSYLRYALKTAVDPRRLLEQKREAMSLSPQFQSLLEPFATPKVAEAENTERKIQRLDEQFCHSSLLAADRCSCAVLKSVEPHPTVPSRRSISSPEST